MVSEEDYPEHLRVTEKSGEQNEKYLDRKNNVPMIKVQRLETCKEEELKGIEASESNYNQPMPI